MMDKRAIIRIEAAAVAQGNGSEICSLLLVNLPCLPVSHPHFKDNDKGEQVMLCSSCRESLTAHDLLQVKEVTGVQPETIAASDSDVFKLHARVVHGLRF